MIHKEFKHNLFGKTTIGDAEVDAKSKETIFGEIIVPTGFTGLSASIYQLASPTGTGPWLKLSGDISSQENLFYTGMNTKIEWQLDPTYLIGSQTGAQHGEIYGVEFLTDQTGTASSKKHATNVIININDTGAF